MKTFRYLLLAFVFISFNANAETNKDFPKTEHLKPPLMGWASWNNYRVKINEDKKDLSLNAII